MFASRRFSPIGIELGADSVTLAQLRWTPSDPELIGLEHRDLLEQTEDRNQVLHRSILSLLDRGSFRGSRVILGLSTQHLFVQNFRIQQSEFHNMDGIVEREAHDRLPEGFGKAEIRYLIAGDVRTTTRPEAGDSHKEVILMAYPREEIDSVMNLCRSLRLKPAGIDPPACALVRNTLMLMRRKVDNDVVQMFVDVSHEASTAVITRGKRIVFVKSIPISGRTIDERLAQKMGLELGQVTSIRREWMKGQQNADSQLDSTVSDAVRREMDLLGSELLKCIRYHDITFRGNRISKILLHGKESRETLTELLTQRTGVECELGNPFQGIQIGQSINVPEPDAPGPWCVALGLCQKLKARAA